MEKKLWVEKYRPSILTDYVFCDERQKKMMEHWVSSKDIPHILFYGRPGTGKTTAALMLANELQLDPYDILFLNASKEKDINTMRSKIYGFVSTMPFSRFRLVILDEGDFITPDSQAILRGLMEQYSDTSRFIITCNYPNRIIPAIHSRTLSVELQRLDTVDFTARVATILATEGKTFDLDVLDSYVSAFWPDLRKCINVCQQNSMSGTLAVYENNDASSNDYKLEAITLLKAGKLLEARKLICSQIKAEDLEEFFTFCYNNLALWGKTQEQQDSAILIIRDSMVQIPLAADPEILVAATLIKLTQL